MRANVLSDREVMRHAGQFAWLSIDQDKPENAAFNAKFPSEGVPMFLVIDPATEKVALSWYGTATAPQLAKLMEDGARAVAGGGSGADAVLAHADELNGQKEFAKAADAYEEALKMGGPEWPKRSRTVESLVMAYTFAKNQSACVEAAAREAPSMPRDRSFVNTVSLALDCSKPGMPEVPALQKLGEEGLKIPGVLADDISGLYFTLASSYRAEKDEADATRIGTERVEYLRRQLAKTPNPEARMAYVLQLVSAANFLHKPDLALPEVQRAERELPKDYNPPRLEAGLYRDLGRYDDALQACDRAMGKAYGLAKLRLYLLRGKIQELNGEPEAAKKTYNDGVAFGQTLPESAAKGTVKALEDALGAVGQLKRR